MTITRRNLLTTLLVSPLAALWPKFAKAEIWTFPAIAKPRDLTIAQIMPIAAPAILAQKDYRSLGYTTKGPYQLDNSTAFVMEMRHNSPRGFYFVPMVWSEKDNTSGSEADKINFCRAMLINGIESLTDFMDEKLKQQHGTAIRYLTNAWNAETKGKPGLHEFTLYVSPALYRAYASELTSLQRITTHYDGPLAPPTLVFKLGRVIADPALTHWDYRFHFHPRYTQLREPLPSTHARPALAELSPQRITD